MRRPTLRELSNGQGTYEYLTQLSREVERLQTALMKLRMPTGPVAQPSQSGTIDLSAIRRALSASGSHPLSLEGLSGTAISPQPLKILEVTSLPPVGSQEVGTVAVKTGTPNDEVYYVSNTNPKRWVLLDLGGGSFITSDTDETIVSTVNKTWQGVQFFNAQYGVHTYDSADQTISDSTTTTVDWDSEVFDEGGWHDNAVNSSRLTVPAGVSSLLLIAQVAWTLGAGDRQVLIRKNGTTSIAGNALGAAATPHIQQVACIDRPSASDYYEVRVWQNSGGNEDVVAGSGFSFFQAHMLG